MKTNPTKTSYRPDIDGLRAIAVLPVVFYHLGLPGFTGGFVGVDIFFVISGYLITGIIYKEVQAGQFSLATFYSRRIRRILPALLAVMLFVLVVGYFVLLPNDFENLGQSTFAVSMFVSNIFFWIKTDYFEVAAESLPLLHTWSLAVEEQFYILWPLILLAVARTGISRLKVGVVIAFFVSLTASQWHVFSGTSDTAFYMSHLRAWNCCLVP